MHNLKQQAIQAGDISQNYVYNEVGGSINYIDATSQNDLTLRNAGSVDEALLSLFDYAYIENLDGGYLGLSLH